MPTQPFETRRLTTQGQSRLAASQHLCTSTLGEQSGADPYKTQTLQPRLNHHSNRPTASFMPTKLQRKIGVLKAGKKKCRATPPYVGRYLVCAYQSKLAVLQCQKMYAPGSIRTLRTKKGTGRTGRASSGRLSRPRLWTLQQLVYSLMAYSRLNMSSTLVR